MLSRDPPDGVDLAGLPLREIFLGHALGPSAKYPKYRHRLLRRGTIATTRRALSMRASYPEGVVQPFEGD